MSGRDYVTGAVRAAVNAHRDHDTAREEALYDAIAGGHFERDPYSPHATPTEYSAPCQCRARWEWDTDGDTKWQECKWDNSQCTAEDA